MVKKCLQGRVTHFFSLIPLCIKCKLTVWWSFIKETGARRNAPCQHWVHIRVRVVWLGGFDEVCIMCSRLTVSSLWRERQRVYWFRLIFCVLVVFNKCGFLTCCCTTVVRHGECGVWGGKRRRLLHLIWEQVLVSFDLLLSCCVRQVRFPDRLLQYCGQA